MDERITISTHVSISEYSLRIHFDSTAAYTSYFPSMMINWDQAHFSLLQINSRSDSYIHYTDIDIVSSHYSLHIPHSASGSNNRITSTVATKHFNTYTNIRIYANVIISNYLSRCPFSFVDPNCNFHFFPPMQ